MQVIGERFQVDHRAEFGLDLAVGRHCVPAVICTAAWLEQRHEVQVTDAEIIQVVDVLAHAVEVAGEAIGVHGIADHRRLLVPVRPVAALEITLF